MNYPKPTYVQAPALHKSILVPQYKAVRIIGYSNNSFGLPDDLFQPNTLNPDYDSSVNINSMTPASIGALVGVSIVGLAFAYFMRKRL